MRDVVRARFVEFTAPLEGIVNYMYLDVKGLVTVGIGNLCDPIQYAMPLPFVVRESGLPALPSDIANEWHRVKADKSLARLGHRAAERITELRLTPAGVDMVVQNKLTQNDQHLRARFDDFDDWPACAQLATHSMAWACGPAFRFDHLVLALRARDFATAATECHMNETGNPGLIPRNKANKILYRNAQRIDAYKLDPDLIDWTEDLAAVETADTEPVPVTMASEPTVIVHVDPSEYLRNRDDQDDNT